MPKTFYINKEKPMRHLLTTGRVYILRQRKIDEGIAQLKSKLPQYKNINKKIQVKFVEELWSPAELLTYVNQSGYHSIHQWIREEGTKRYLYKVTII